jgi:hypothetical protein
MEQQASALEAAVRAAGMAVVYNAEDWDRIVDKRPRATYEDELLPPPEMPH